MIFQKYKNIREWWYKKYSNDYQKDDFYEYCKNGNVEGAFVAIKKDLTLIYKTQPIIIVVVWCMLVQMISTK